MRDGLRPGGGRPKGAKTERTRAIAEQVALPGLTPLEVMMEAMRHYQAIGNQTKPWPLPRTPRLTCTRACMPWLVLAEYQSPRTIGDSR